VTRRRHWLPPYETVAQVKSATVWSPAPGRGKVLRPA
jgi:hypothetical protein